MKTPKPCVLRARCTLGEKASVQRAVKKIGIDESDIVRLAVRYWLSRKKSNVAA